MITVADHVTALTGHVILLASYVTPLVSHVILLAVMDHMKLPLVICSHVHDIVQVCGIGWLHTPALPVTADHEWRRPRLTCRFIACGISGNDESPMSLKHKHYGALCA